MQEEYYYQYGCQSEEEWKFLYKNMCDLVDKMNSEVCGFKTPPINDTFNQDKVPLRNRIRLLKNAINFISEEKKEMMRNK